MKPTSAKSTAEELQLLHALRLPHSLQHPNAMGSQVIFHGLSMEPILRDGDRVILEPVSWDEIEIGDIVTYRHQDKYPTRRVVARGGDSVSLWCDNWPDLRFRAGAQDILGRVAARIREGRELRRDQDEWKARTSAALGEHKRSLPQYLLRCWHRAVARHILRRDLPLLPR